MTGVLAYADIYWVERIKGLVRDAGGVGHPILLRILITTSPAPPARPDDPTPALIVRAAALRRRSRDAVGSGTSTWE